MEGGNQLDRKTSVILGSLFFLMSGLLFTIERLGAYVHRIAQITSGSYPTELEMPSLFANLFVPLFILIGIALIVMAFSNVALSDEEKL